MLPEIFPADSLSCPSRREKTTRFPPAPLLTQALSLSPPRPDNLPLSTWHDLSVSQSLTMSTTQPGMFQCGSCKKNYKRLDHLARHVRSRVFASSIDSVIVAYLLYLDTQTKPYKCHVCPKAFTRPLV
jgi:uncharacterized Zn-finger protein